MNELDIIINLLSIAFYNGKVSFFVVYFNFNLFAYLDTVCYVA